MLSRPYALRAVIVLILRKNPTAKGRLYAIVLVSAEGCTGLRSTTGFCRSGWISMRRGQGERTPPVVIDFVRANWAEHEAKRCDPPPSEDLPRGPMPSGEIFASVVPLAPEGKRNTAAAHTSPHDWIRSTVHLRIKKQPRADPHLGTTVRGASPLSPPFARAISPHPYYLSPFQGFPARTRRALDYSSTIPLSRLLYQE